MEPQVRDSHLLRTLALAGALLLLACSSAATRPASSSGDPTDAAPPHPAVIDLPEGTMYPEGVAAGGESLYVSVFGSGSLLRIDADDTISVFAEPGVGGLRSPVGIAADLQRQRLWVASFDAETFTSTLIAFDLGSGDVLASLDAPADHAPHFFNEVVLADDGRVFVSDTLQPRIWTAGPDLAQPLTILAEDPALANPEPERAFGLNGLALAPGGEYLVASVMDRITQGGGRLVRVATQGGALQEVTLTGDIDTFGGSDGMFFNQGRLVMVNVTPPDGLVTATFATDYTSAVLESQPVATAGLNRPSSVALRGDRLWVVNSQLDHVVDDGNGAIGTDPDFPFQIVGFDAAHALGN